MTGEWPPVLAACCLGAAAAGASLGQVSTPVTVRSPSGQVVLTVRAGQAGPPRPDRLTWQITLSGHPVILPSALGIIVDGRDLGEGALVVGSEPYEIDERYPWRGVHSEAVNRARGARIQATHPGTTITYTIDARVADDSVAVRYVVPGKGPRVPDAGMTFQIPEGSIVWSHGLRDHYEAVYERRRIEDVPEGDWAAPPVTIELPGGAGYAAIMEADLRDYAGMALQADGRRGYRERLGHDHPTGYPYTLRFGEENAARLAVAAPVEDTITTPWRVVVLGRDLDTLVNADAVHNLCPPPDPTLFPEGIRTPWLKPGRAVWRYLDGGDGTVAGIKEFSRLAGELGFEYQVIEGQWQRWTEEELGEVVEYSRARGVRLLVWRHRNTLGDPVKRRALFASLQKAGVAGLKVDFLDHEAKEVIDLYQDILRDAAEHQLLIDFHGANKPAGEPRTWPNEMTREGIYGLEHRRMEAWAGFNTTFPFVRMLAGHADYTPVVFGERRRETSWAHQIASAAILTSPLLVYGGHPASLLSNPGAEMIKSIPSVWDETRVLPPSEIGELALFARRSGDRWFVAAMNGPTGRTLKLDLSFLPPGAYRALVVRDDLERADAIEVETRDIATRIPLEVPVRPAGGFVIRFTRVATTR
ncbi:MAG TPA: glycoside hydrolase family 97 catalytic domain-containing protein [Vicinamibacterales bacterium]|nr:glycoside hydrolase family 97 catalytic domain-containing protein [Vicinamibacterales bacterium]